MPSAPILQSQVNNARQQYREALATLKAAKAAATAAADEADIDKRQAIVDAEAEAEEAEDAYNKIRQQRTSMRMSTTSSSAPTPDLHDWEKRHDYVHHLLVVSLSEQYQGMTIKCPDLPSLWRALEKHFEGKSAADVIHAENLLMSLTLSDQDNPEEFLNSVRLVQTQMESCGAEYPDARMFLTVAQKLPPRMHGLRDQFLYGPKERQNFASLEQAINEFAKNNPLKREP